MKKTLIFVALVVIIAGLFIFGKGNSASDTSVNNVSVVDGVQIIEISAKGGYHPLKSTAKAGIPTVIRFNTDGTFDCSSAVRIPSMDISRALPQSGVTDIDIGTQNIATLQGTCGMGMYPFEIDFQS
jgi:plastocyanin domain-containing protein